jgi:hypothetical protein
MGSRAEAKEPTAEELASRKRVITGGITKGGVMNENVGAEILLNPDGNGFNFGGVASDPSSKFKWNEKTGDYRSNGGGILKLAKVAAPAQEGSSGGGGGGGKNKPKPKPGHKPPVTQTDVYDTIIPGTGGLLASEGMDNWNPISSNGNGGAGLNPLVDPQEWLVDLPELNMGKQSRLWIPKKRFYGGLV